MTGFRIATVDLENVDETAPGDTPSLFRFV